MVGLRRHGYPQNAANGRDYEILPHSKFSPVIRRNSWNSLLRGSLRRLFLLFLARALEDVEQAIVRLVTGVLINRISGIELERNMHGPGPGPGARILDGGVIAELIGRGAREAFDNSQLVGE